MDKFKSLKEVTSPHSTHSNSPFQMHRSFVTSRQGVNEINPTKLDFKAAYTVTESKFSNAHMIQSQVMGNSTIGTSIGSQKNVFANDNSGMKSSNIHGRFGSGKIMIGSIVNDPMKESTISYIQTFSRGMPNISEERLRQISQNFIRLYGTDREISKNGAKNIQRQAHLQANTKFQQNSETVDSLHSILDGNRDGKVSHEDITNAARRYLSFEKQQIVYTPMVEERLAVARRLFKQFDVERKGHLTEKQVPNLLRETYRCLGKVFNATQEDVQSWMKLTDRDNDGLVTLPDYENSIIRALKKQGVRIYQD